ncbi:hypothetical protein Tco_0781782 [Tanacetum coccineum]
MEYHNDLMDFVPPRPHDSPLSGGNTPGSDEGRLELIQELMEPVNHDKKVLAFEEARMLRHSDHQLKLRAKEARKQRKGSGEKGGSTADQVSTARPEVGAASVPVNTLVKMRSKKAKEKEKGVVLIDEEEPPRLNISTTTLQLLLTIVPKDKGNGVLVKEEPEKLVKVKRRDQGLAQIESDAELAKDT